MRKITILFIVFTSFSIMFADEWKSISPGIDFSKEVFAIEDGCIRWKYSTQGFDDFEFNYAYFRMHDYYPDTIRRSKVELPIGSFGVLLPPWRDVDSLSYSVSNIVLIDSGIPLRDTRKTLHGALPTSDYTDEELTNEPYFETNPYYEWLDTKPIGKRYDIYRMIGLRCRPFRYDTISRKLYTVNYDLEISLRYSPDMDDSIHIFEIQRVYDTGYDRLLDKVKATLSKEEWAKGQRESYIRAVKKKRDFYYKEVFSKRLINSEYWYEWYDLYDFVPAYQEVNAVSDVLRSGSCIISHSGQGFHLRIDEGVKDARLEVRDVQGRTVKETALTMRGEVLTATTGTPLPRGTYVCTLVTDGRVAGTKKMQVK